MSLHYIVLAPPTPPPWPQTLQFQDFSVTSTMTIHIPATGEIFQRRLSLLVSNNSSMRGEYASGTSKCRLNQFTTLAISFPCMHSCVAEEFGNLLLRHEITANYTNNLDDQYCWLTIPCYRLTTGTCIQITGEWKPSPGSKQNQQAKELHYHSLKILGTTDPEVMHLSF